MTKNNDRNQGGEDNTQKSQGQQSIGNQQGTAQTGAQNSGGTKEKEDDHYTEDLQRSGDRSSSNKGS